MSIEVVMLVQGGEKSMKLLLLLGDGGFAMANVCRDGVWWWWVEGGGGRSESRRTNGVWCGNGERVDGLRELGEE